MSNEKGAGGAGTPKAEVPNSGKRQVGYMPDVPKAPGKGSIGAIESPFVVDPELTCGCVATEDNTFSAWNCAAGFERDSSRTGIALDDFGADWVVNSDDSVNVAFMSKGRAGGGGGGRNGGGGTNKSAAGDALPCCKMIFVDESLVNEGSNASCTKFVARPLM